MIHTLVDTLNFATESGPGFYFFIAGGGEGSLLLPHQPGRDDFMASPQQEGEQKALVWAFGEKPLLFREGTCTAVDWGRGVWFYCPEQQGAGGWTSAPVCGSAPSLQHGDSCFLHGRLLVCIFGVYSHLYFPYSFIFSVVTAVRKGDPDVTDASLHGTGLVFGGDTRAVPWRCLGLLGHVGNSLCTHPRSLSRSTGLWGAEDLFPFFLPCWAEEAPGARCTWGERHEVGFGACRGITTSPRGSPCPKRGSDRERGGRSREGTWVQVASCSQHLCLIR